MKEGTKGHSTLSCCDAKGVLWRNWDKGALEEAKKADKPVFLIIHHGGSRWSHAMEESFKNPEVVKLLNQNFVAILAEQEEVPHLALAARTLCQLMNGRGGWPLNLFMTPDRRPFFAGSYMPTESSNPQMPGLLDVLRRIKWLWLMKREQMEAAADSFQAQLAQALLPAEGPLPEGLRSRALSELLEASDQEWGGFGRQPKFPQVPRLLLLACLSDDPRAKKLLDHTLTAMAAGALRDHLEGAFHSYCLDRQWRVPNLGRRLIDQTAILRAYVEGYKIFESPLYRNVIQRGLTSVLERLRRDDGLLSTGENLFHSEGTKEDYYLWTKGEIWDILGEEGAFFCQACGITEEGNFPDPLTGKNQGKNVLWLDLAASGYSNVSDLMQRLEPCWSELSKVQLNRDAPPLEDRAVTASTALFAGVLARASRVLGAPQWAQESEKILRAMTGTMIRGTELFHGFFNGEPHGEANLEDFSALIWTCLELFQSGGSQEWLDLGELWSQRALETFGDRGAMALMPPGTLEIMASWDGGDGLVPSGNAMMVRNFTTLWGLTGDKSWRDHGRSILDSFGGALKEYPGACAGLVLGAFDLTGPPGSLELQNRKVK